jgi:hypothetical protein
LAQNPISLKMPSAIMIVTMDGNPDWVFHHDDKLSEANKTRPKRCGRPQRTARMWLRDLCERLRLLSEPPDIQTAMSRNLQAEASQFTKRFLYSLEQFKRTHDAALPLNLSERLGWLAQLTAALPRTRTLNSIEWQEIRSVATDCLAMIEKS